MSSTVQVPMPEVHRHRLLLSLAVAAVCLAVAVAGVVAVLDRGSASTAVRTAHATHVPTQSMGPIEGGPPIVCASEYGSLLGVMGTSMTPEAVDRITAVLSGETLAGLRSTAAALATANVAPDAPDPLTLAWAIGQLAPSEALAILAELPPAMRDAVTHVDPAATAVVAQCS